MHSFLNQTKKKNEVWFLCNNVAWPARPVHFLTKVKWNLSKWPLLPLHSIWPANYSRLSQMGQDLCDALSFWSIQWVSNFVGPCKCWYCPLNFELVVGLFVPSPGNQTQFFVLNRNRIWMAGQATINVHFCVNTWNIKLKCKCLTCQQVICLVSFFAGVIASAVSPGVTGWGSIYHLWPDVVLHKGIAP